jgi:engulfment/cell motility protein 1
MWHESGSKVDDLGRVTFLVRSQIRLSLADEGSKTWLHLERDFLETPYATIRERQMEVLEKEDGTMNRPAVKLLREKLNVEAQDVMMEQRYVSLSLTCNALMSAGLDACCKELGSMPRI